MLFKKHPVSSIATLSALLFTQSIWAADTLTDALTGGKASGNLQYRYEDVRNNFATVNTATANTLRLRLGYETGTFKGFGAMVEAESLTSLDNTKYNSTANGRTTYAVIADPATSEMNQAYLSYSASNTTVKWGRQRLVLDNHRFIGNVGWRQNEQTFDALTLVNKSLPNTTITAGYITNVNRPFSDDALSTNSTAQMGNHKMKSPILNVNYKGWSFAEVVGYAYVLDYRVNNATLAALPTTTNYNPNLTTNTYGLRLNGSTPMGGNKLLYTAEFAHQTDGSNNPVKFKTNYTFLEGGVDVTNVAVFKLGYEVLGTDTSAIIKSTNAVTQKSFSTPLATLHAMNGWADMFLATPAQGLKDTYLSANTKLAGINLGAVYHDYREDKAVTGKLSKFGTEWDLVATKTFDKNYTIGLKYADYKANNASTSTSTAVAGNTFAGNTSTKKTWLWGEFKF